MVDKSFPLTPKFASTAIPVPLATNSNYENSIQKFITSMGEPAKSRVFLYLSYLKSSPLSHDIKQDINQLASTSTSSFDPNNLQKINIPGVDLSFLSQYITNDSPPSQILHSQFESSQQKQIFQQSQQLPLQHIQPQFPQSDLVSLTSKNFTSSQSSLPSQLFPVVNQYSTGTLSSSEVSHANKNNILLHPHPLHLQSQSNLQTQSSSNSSLTTRYLPYLVF